MGIDHHDLMHSDEVGEPGELTRDELLAALIEDAEAAYAKREADIEALAGEGAMRQLERNVLLNVLDRKWREHLYEMDYLKEGIGLRAMAQRDPLVEYQREGYDMFMAMLEGLKEVGRLPVQRSGPGGAADRSGCPVATPEGLAKLGGGAAAEGTAQSGLHAKGVDDDSRPLTYSGPAEGRVDRGAPQWWTAVGRGFRVT